MVPFQIDRGAMRRKYPDNRVINRRNGYLHANLNPELPFPINPMKAYLGEPSPGIDWEFEVKWDGYRAVAFCGERFRLQGRRLNEIGPDFPEIAGLGSDEIAKGKVLDGELVVFDEAGRPDFQLMQSRRDSGRPVHFLVFDLLWADGEDLRPRSYIERREALESLGLAGESWSVPDRIEAGLDDALRATAELGLEGIVAKNPDSPYVEGKRTHYWMKVKHELRQEFVVGGWLPGKGHRSGTLGALLLGYRNDEGDLLYAGRVGTGMTDELLVTLTAEMTSSESEESPFLPPGMEVIPRNARWCEPLIVVEVKFTEWTREGNLRNPVFTGLRPDKSPAEVVREA